MQNNSFQIPWKEKDNRSQTGFMGIGVRVGTTSGLDCIGRPCRGRTYGPLIKSSIQTKLRKTFLT
jgi:hypothetical protein